VGEEVEVVGVGVGLGDKFLGDGDWKSVV